MPGECEQPERRPVSATPRPLDDPWAWARETPEDPRPDLTDVVVAAVVSAPATGIERIVAAIAGQTVAPAEIVVADTGDLDPVDPAALGAAAGGVPVRVVPAAGEAGAGAGDPAPNLDQLRAAVTVAATHYWAFAITSDLDLPPRTLEALLITTQAAAGADVTAPLVLRRASRRTDAFIEWAGMTLTPAGVPVSPEGGGEVDQGQIGTTQVLGVPAVGMLVTADAADRAGGLGAGALPGLDLGASVTAGGGRVAVTGHAPVTFTELAPPEAAAERRRAGLNLASALSRAPAWTAITTVVGSVLAIIGSVLGRDLPQAGTIARALRGWLGDRAVRTDLRARLATSTPDPDRRRVQQLRMSRGAVMRQAVTSVAGQVGDWVDGFSARVDSGSVIDDLTSDEQTIGRANWRLSPAVVGFLTLLVGAVVAGVHLFAPGRVTGQLLLPAPDFGGLWAAYLEPVAGQPGGSGPPWLALLGLVSVLTFGNVDLAVAIGLFVTVPVAWLATYRLLRQLLSEQVLAVVAALVIALAPVLTGGVNRGSLAANWVVLVVVLAALAGLRLVREPSWRWAIATGLCLTLLVVGTPLLWVPGAAVAVWAVATGRVSWPHALVAVAAPILALAPWLPTLWRWPGRLLTGPEPMLAPTATPDVWWLLLARDAGTGLPPLWLGAIVAGAVWAVAVAGLVRGGSRSWPGWGLALVGLVGAIGLSRVLVSVPPDGVARPELSVWLALFLAGLVLAAALGCDGIVAELRGSSLGWRQVLAGVLALAAVGATVLAAGWWVVGGTKGLSRDDMSTIPPFVRNAQTSATPGRTLAVSVRDGVARWALVEDTLPRLGDGERGLAAGGSAAAQEQAAGVVARLMAGTADDALIADLRSLGVTHIWVAGADQQVRTAIGNTPGLGIGSGDAESWVWQVPQSGRVLIVSGDRASAVGAGVEVAPGDSGRELVLSEPADPRWRAAVGGVDLEALPTTDWRQRFAVPPAGGTLTVHLDVGPPWWAWVQLAGLVFGLVMVLPTTRGAAPIGMRGAA